MNINFQVIDGYAYGSIQPSGVFRFDEGMAALPAIERIHAEFLNCLLDANIADFRVDDGITEKIMGGAKRILQVLEMLNAHCGDQRFSAVRVIQQDHKVLFVVPTLSPRLVRDNFEAILALVKNGPSSLETQEIKSFLGARKQICRRFLPSGSINGNLLEAAAEYKIPFHIFSSRTMIFGYGSGCSLSNGSITAFEKSTGVALASSKVDTNRLFRLAGIPVADQALVTSIETAVSQAKKFEYPVVLKPEKQEQGRGVYANIIDEHELRAAYARVSKKYKTMILEKHIKGDAYRITTLNGEIFRAMKFEAGHVVGDGASTILNLIEKENMNPHRQSNLSSMGPITVDDDVTALLRKVGYELTSVPSLGEKVTLVSVSNLSRGGTASSFLDELHPDNRDICIQAAKTTGLFCCGVDLISVDASRPWHENGAVVCEVNAQPQINFERVDIHTLMVLSMVQSYPEIHIVVSNDHEPASPIFNKTLDSIDVHLHPDQVLRNGCPTQYFTDLTIDPDVPQADQDRILAMLVSVLPERDGSDLKLDGTDSL